MNHLADVRPARLKEFFAAPRFLQFAGFVVGTVFDEHLGVEIDIIKIGVAPSKSLGDMGKNDA